VSKSKTNPGDKASALREWREKRNAMGDKAPPIVTLDPIQKARENPTSLRAAINGKCWDCAGAGADPNTRKAIRECKCGDYCTLWSVRPYQKKKGIQQGD
jgi:hypothetical protein